MSLGRWAPAAAAAVAAAKKVCSDGGRGTHLAQRAEQSEEGKARKDGFLKPSGFCSSHKGHEIRWNKKVSFFKALPSMAESLMALTLAYRNRAWERATFSQVDHQICRVPAMFLQAPPSVSPSRYELLNHEYFVAQTVCAISQTTCHKTLRRTCRITLYALTLWLHSISLGVGLASTAHSK